MISIKQIEENVKHHISKTSDMSASASQKGLMIVDAEGNTVMDNETFIEYMNLVEVMGETMLDAIKSQKKGRS